MSEQAIKPYIESPHDAELLRLMNSPAASNWLRAAISGALDRDPVDAARDAAMLAQVLGARVDALLKGRG